MASKDTAAAGGSQVARSITALVREARELRGTDDEARREAYLARKQQLLADLEKEADPDE